MSGSLIAIQSRYIIVGSGPGGSLAACLLAEAGEEVLVLEEGLEDAEFRIPPFSRPEMEEKYRNGGITMAFGRSRIQYIEGCCLGGGGEVNSGLYHRLPESIRERWQNRWQVTGLDAISLEAFSLANERELSVSFLPGEAPKPSSLLAEGAASLGFYCVEAPRWQRYDVPEPGGKRQTMSATMLPRAVKAGAIIRTDAKAVKITRGSGCWHVEAMTGIKRGEPKREIFTGQKLILAAGAIQTPVLLQRNRLGKRAGKFLQMHPTLKVTAVFPEEVNTLDMGVPVHQVKAFGTDMSMGCSISSPHYLMASFKDTPGGAALVRDLWPRMASYYVMITPDKRGRVRALPGFKDPLVTFPLTYRDRTILSLGLKRLCEILFAAGTESLYLSIKGMPPINSRAELGGIPQAVPPKESELMTIHLTSSCPMSDDPALGVTDSWGAVHGEENLYIADAGLLCTAPGVNPQGPLMAVVRRNVTHWLEQQRKNP